MSTTFIKHNVAISTYPQNFTTDKLSNVIKLQDSSINSTDIINSSVLNLLSVNTDFKFQLIHYTLLVLTVGVVLLFVVVFLAKLNQRFNLVVKASNVVTTLKGASVSVYEVVALTTIFVTIIIFDAISAAVEEDVLDSAAGIIFVFCISVILFAIFSLGYTLVFIITPKCAGDYLLTFAIYDIINFVLCLLRIIMCWSRYIFYDLQLESIDMALQYTDEVEGWINQSTNVTNINFVLLVLEVQLDLIFVAVQTLLSLFKLLIASYLTFLVADLFIIRPVTTTTTLWYLIIKKA